MKADLADPKNGWVVYIVRLASSPMYMSPMYMATDGEVYWAPEDCGVQLHTVDRRSLLDVITRWNNDDDDDVDT